MGQSVLIAVIKREIDRMLSRRIYFVACIVLPLFSLFLWEQFLVTDKWRIFPLVSWMVIIRLLPGKSFVWLR